MGKMLDTYNNHYMRYQPGLQWTAGVFTVPILYWIFRERPLETKHKPNKNYCSYNTLLLECGMCFDQQFARFQQKSLGFHFDVIKMSPCSALVSNDSYCYRGLFHDVCDHSCDIVPELTKQDLKPSSLGFNFTLYKKYRLRSNDRLAPRYNEGKHQDILSVTHALYQQDLCRWRKMESHGWYYYRYKCYETEWDHEIEIVDAKDNLPPIYHPELTNKKPTASFHLIYILVGFLCLPISGYVVYNYKQTCPASLCIDLGSAQYGYVYMLRAGGKEVCSISQCRNSVLCKQPSVGFEDVDGTMVYGEEAVRTIEQLAYVDKERGTIHCLSIQEAVRDSTSKSRECLNLLLTTYSEQIQRYRDGPDRCNLTLIHPNPDEMPTINEEFQNAFYKQVRVMSDEDAAAVAVYSEHSTNKLSRAQPYFVIYAGGSHCACSEYKAGNCTQSISYIEKGGNHIDTQLCELIVDALGATTMNRLKMRHPLKWHCFSRLISNLKHVKEKEPVLNISDIQQWIHGDDDEKVRTNGFELQRDNFGRLNFLKIPKYVISEASKVVCETDFMQTVSERINTSSTKYVFFVGGLGSSSWFQQRIRISNKNKRFQTMNPAERYSMYGGALYGHGKI